MLPIESPMACVNCGSDRLLHGLTFGKVNQFPKNSPPGSTQPFIEPGWAMYLCFDCMGVFPYNRSYVGSKNLQDKYVALVEMGMAHVAAKSPNNDAKAKLEALLDQLETMSGLPSFNKDEYFNRLLAPYDARLRAVEEEIKRKKGGRPRKDE